MQTKNLAVGTEPAMDELSHVFEKVSQYFSLLSEPMRLRILHAICQGERTVNEVVAETCATQTNVSRHLNAMYRAGVLTRRKKGTFVFYSVADRVLTDLCRNVCTHMLSQMDHNDVQGRALQTLAKDLVTDGAGI
jgi:DNA-binding transcriptional ArsR family regulator